MSRTADVIIVGAGIVGSSTALELTRAGYSVLVIDKAGGPGFGSTSASSAVVRFDYSTWDGMTAAWESKFRWEEWSDHLGYTDPTGLASFKCCGLVFLDVDIMPRDRMAKMFIEAGIPFEEWGACRADEGLSGYRHRPLLPPEGGHVRGVLRRRNRYDQFGQIHTGQRAARGA